MAKNTDFLIGVLVGSAIGAAAALMYAPSSGVETRENIKLKADEARHRANELAAQARQRAQEIADQARTRSTELVDQAKTRVGDLNNQAHSVVDRGRALVENQRDAIRTAVDAGKQAYQEKSSELHKEVADDTQPAGGTPTA